MTRVLVIKLAALGDFVQAIGPMQRIRAAHPRARLTLLTTAPYVDLGRATGLFDEVRGDGRPRRLGSLLRMLLSLRREGYSRVYDLQTSMRSSAYRHAWWGRSPEWSGIGRGVSHPHDAPDRDAMHTLERQADQLRRAGVWRDAPTAPGTAPAPDLGFVRERLDLATRAEDFNLPKRYALLVPGASPSRPEKRWPAASYVVLAQRLAAVGLTPVVIGGPAEAELASRIARESGAVDLAGATTFVDIAALATGAAVAIGNDTGPMHLIAATGAPTVVLFSGASDPALCAPRGACVRTLRKRRLEDLEVDTVSALALALVDGGCEPDRPVGR